jgi:hypothetical protein
VDLDWCNSSEHLANIMSNEVATKLFRDKSILCVHKEFLPDKKGLAPAVPRIILAMGASRVEVASEERYSSGQLDEYDYLVVKEGEERIQGEGITCVDVDWVKKCLIAGRLLDIPNDEN